MNLDIRLKTSFPRHPKVIKFKREMGTWEPIITLWLWAAENKPSGDLTGMEAEDIAIACGYSGDANALLDALLKHRFIDTTGSGSLKLHAWVEHNAYAAHAEKRSKKAKKAAEARWQKRLGNQEDPCSSIAKQCSEDARSNAPSPNPSPNPYPIPSPNPNPSPINNYAALAREVIDDFNDLFGTSYKANSTKIMKLINARVKEGHTINDFRIVHRNMKAVWEHDPKMKNYLRPQTLYTGNFDSYLNYRVTLSGQGKVSEKTERGMKAIEDFVKKGAIQ